MTELTPYQKWLDYVFGRPVTDPAWYFERAEGFEADKATIVDLVSKTFAESGTDLTQFTNAQLNLGFSYIFYNHASDVIYAICQKGVAEEERVETVKNMSILYRDCFSVRCDPVLSHLAEPCTNPLNAFCYMVWDLSPLCQWKSVVLEVMERALYLPNTACVESALHGLNHRYHQSPDEVSAIIDRFLLKTKNLRPELRHYAMIARTGRAQ